MVNKVTLIGRVGQQPEIRTFDNGNKVVNFTLATSETYIDKNGDKQEITDWHNIAIFGKLVDIVEKYVNKGDLLYLEGKIKTRKYESNGETKYVTEIVLRGFDGKLKMLGGKNEQQDSKPQKEHEQADEEESDLPF